MAASAPCASSGSSWFHGTIQVRWPKDIGLKVSSQARSQSSSSTLRKLAPDQSRPSSKASSAASSTRGLASAGNSALSTSSFHSGVSPTPGSRIARSLLVSASASSIVTASAPTSSSAFS